MKSQLCHGPATQPDKFLMVVEFLHSFVRIFFSSFFPPYNTQCLSIQSHLKDQGHFSLLGRWARPKICFKKKRRRRRKMTKKRKKQRRRKSDVYTMLCYRQHPPLPSDLTNFCPTNNFDHATSRKPRHCFTSLRIRRGRRRSELAIQTGNQTGNSWVLSAIPFSPFPPVSLLSCPILTKVFYLSSHLAPGFAVLTIGNCRIEIVVR